jgi:HlyD family secretion protein
MAAAIRSESRLRIEDILRPEQKARYAEIAAEGGRGGTPASGRVWVLDNGKPKAIEVRTGLTDGTATEIAGAGIAEGMELLGGTLTASGATTPAKGGPPRMFF